MTPPGLGIVAINTKSWKKIESSKSPRFYWDFNLYKEAQERKPKQTPFTSPVSLMLGLREAFEMIIEEGVDNTVLRYAEVASTFREKIKSKGFKLFPKNELDCANTVTSIYTPEGFTSEEIIDRLLQKYNLRVANSLGKLKGKILRIGHMGFQVDLFINLAIVNALSDIVSQDK